MFAAPVRNGQAKKPLPTVGTPSSISLTPDVLVPSPTSGVSIGHAFYLFEVATASHIKERQTKMQGCGPHA